MISFGLTMHKLLKKKDIVIYAEEKKKLLLFNFIKLHLVILVNLPKSFNNSITSSEFASLSIDVLFPIFSNSNYVGKIDNFFFFIFFKN